MAAWTADKMDRTLADSAVGTMIGQKVQYSEQRMADQKAQKMTVR